MGVDYRQYVNKIAIRVMTPEHIDARFNAIRKHRKIPFNLQSKWHSPFNNL